MARDIDSRRHFIGKFASGIAGTLATGHVLGANERIGFGVIGLGVRGKELAREALSSPNTQLVAVADVYGKRLEEAATLQPDVKTTSDYRRLLEDPSIDAVFIATPQHLHAAQFCAALDAGKHVYQEKTMALTVEQAKRMRAAANKARRVVQVGHQAISSGTMADTLRFLGSAPLGRITAIRAHMYRNTPHGRPQWARPVYPDMTPENIDWAQFQDGAPAHEFDARRFINWRFYWDYGGGNVTENMSQQLAFWYKALNLQIPRSVTMTGGIYLWRDGREVPDTMNVTMDQPEDLLWSWDSGFGNSQLETGEYVLGDEGTLARAQQLRYLPQKVNRRDAPELIGQSRTQPAAHVHDFFNSIRSGREPGCPVELGYRVSIACAMAVESYRQGRTVRWDARNEQIV